MSNSRDTNLEFSFGFKQNNASQGYFHPKPSQEDLNSAATFIRQPERFTGKTLVLGLGEIEVSSETISKAVTALKNNQMETLKIEGDADNKKPNTPHTFNDRPAAPSTPKEKKQKQRLDLSNLFTALENHPTLTTLELHQIDLRHEASVRKLNTLVKNNKHLKTLRLINCHIGQTYDPLVYLADNTSLELLDISDNNLGTKFADFLILRLQAATYSQLREINTQGNRFPREKEIAIQRFTQGFTNDDYAERAALYEMSERADLYAEENPEEANNQSIAPQNNIEQTTSSQQRQNLTDADSSSTFFTKPRLIGAALGLILGIGVIAAITIATAGIGAFLTLGLVGWGLTAAFGTGMAISGGLCGDLYTEYKASNANLEPQAASTSPSLTINHLHRSLGVQRNRSNSAPAASSAIMQSAPSSSLPEKTALRYEDGAGIFSEAEHQEIRQQQKLSTMKL